MRDWMGRNLHYLRLSLTERCNLKCIYCREETDFCKAKQELNLRELTQLMNVMVRLGVTKVRLTGGEPLVRKDLEQIIHMVSGYIQIQDLSMTTNAHGLCDRIQQLHQSGLQRVNISMDSLDQERYRRMTRGGDLQQVLNGIDAALREDMQVKINVVLVRGENDNEIDDFIALAKEYPVDVRFIEMMPIGCGRQFPSLNHEDFMAALTEEYPDIIRDHRIHGSGPAVYYQIPGFQGGIGLISAIHGKFCDSCNRVRLTSQGFLKTCLCYEDGSDLRAVLRNGEPEQQRKEHLKEVMRETIARKPAAHCFEQPAKITETHRMASIGG